MVSRLIMAVVTLAMIVLPVFAYAANGANFVLYNHHTEVVPKIRTV